MNKEYFNGVGRRKNSTARVYLSDGKGKFSINNVSDDINSYLKRDSLVIHAVKPLEVLNLKDKYDIKINVKGGGLTGQAGAIQLGIARALLKIDEVNIIVLLNNHLGTFKAIGPVSNSSGSSC